MKGLAFSIPIRMILHCLASWALSVSVLPYHGAVFSQMEMRKSLMRQG